MWRERESQVPPATMTTIGSKRQILSNKYKQDQNHPKKQTNKEQKKENIDHTHAHVDTQFAYKHNTVHYPQTTYHPTTYIRLGGSPCVWWASPCGYCSRRGSAFYMRSSRERERKERGWIRRDCVWFCVLSFSLSLSFEWNLVFALFYWAGGCRQSGETVPLCRHSECAYGEGEHSVDTHTKFIYYMRD